MFKDQPMDEYVTVEKIVSFLPSATELIFELGAEDKLMAVTHECGHPEKAKSIPKVISPVFDPENLSSEEIDKKTAELMNQGKEIFKIDKDVLKSAEPELIISQTTCEVCAAHTNLVERALMVLEKKPSVFSMDPHTIDEIFQHVSKLSRIIGKVKEGDELKKRLRKRIEKISDQVFAEKPKVLAIEWIKPFFTAGHWVPEMIQLAGGENMISKMGEHSRRMKMQEIIDANPDVIVFMPCGFDANRALKEYDMFIRNDSEWKKLRAVRKNRVFVVDANSFFSKPSIRTVTGIEVLAKILHEEKFKNIEVPKNSFLHIE